MKDIVIERAEVFTLGPDVTRFRLAGDMGEVYETLTLVRLHSSCGLEGIAGVTTYSEHCFDEALGLAIKPLLPEVLSKNVNQPEIIFKHLMSRYNSMAPKPQSAIDIALWDLKAKAEGKPLYQVLGGNRDSIRSYASTPFFDTNAEYINFVSELMTLGFNTVKFHTWCELDKDLSLLDEIEKAFGNQIDFMIDLEERYDLEDAKIIAKRLESMNCIWLEAPLLDTDIKGYSRLRENTSVPILPAGNTLLTPGLMQQAIEQNAWDALRTDVTYAGGFSGCRPIAELANVNQLPLELQSWGYTLTQAANLHMMLSIQNSVYFEQAMPYASHEALCNTPIRTEAGIVKASEKPGLGVEMNWDKMKTQTLWHYEIGV